MASAHRRFKDAIYEQFSRVTKALSAPKRLELVDLLAQGPRTVEALAEQAALSVANASQHLQVLRAARLVEAEKKGLFVEYRLASGAVGAAWVTLRALAEARLAEIDELTRAHFEPMDQERCELEPVAQDELARRVRSGAVTVIDVRPEAEFRAGHIRGAISAPLESLRERMRALPADRAVVAYCRGRYCVMALDAVRTLRAHGFVAHRMELGVLDWRARGWGVARTRARA